MRTTRSHERLTPIAQRSLALVTVSGSNLFFVLYVIAAWCYPGGSNANRAAFGFNIYTNYWCDLLGSHAKNGQLNPAQPIAFTAMLELCLTLAYFWYVTPAVFNFPKPAQRFLQTAGALSMIVAPFIFTAHHDTIINIAGSLGVLAMLGTFAGLYKNQHAGLFRVGLGCLFLCGLNNYMYYTHWFIEHLPIIQKITFFLFLLWFCFVSLTLRGKPMAHE